MTEVIKIAGSTTFPPWVSVTGGVLTVLAFATDNTNVGSALVEIMVTDDNSGSYSNGV